MNNGSHMDFQNFHDDELESQIIILFLSGRDNQCGVSFR